MAMTDEALYVAARRVLDSGLGEDGSAFTPGKPVWTASVVADLMARFVDAPLLGSDSFVVKLSGQLGGAPPETVQLAAELLYFHLLAPVDIGGAAKRSLLERVLALAPEPVQIPPELNKALDGGFARVGTAYLTMRDRQLAYLVRFVDAWKGLPTEEQAAALCDPWLFRDVADSVPINSAYAQRLALLHLAFPAVFESIVSRKHKQAILAAFESDLDSRTDDEDRDLLALRQKLEAAAGGAISYYEGDLLERWRPSPDTSAPGGAARRGWLVRGNDVGGRNLIPEWLTHGYCSLAYREIPELAAGLSRPELDDLVAKAMPDWSVRQRSIHVGVLHRFLTEMQPGDLVVTVDGPTLYEGTVTGPPIWIETPGGVANRQRRVDWLRPDPPLRRDQLSDAARDKLRGQMTVSDLGASTGEYLALADLADETADEPGTGIGEPAAPALETLPAATEQLAQRLFVDRAWLDETIELLAEKRQLVLYGPPGTGKTYLAQELALHVTEQTGGSYRLVQFHPSYAYEDFFEGFRPQQGSEKGTISFSLEPGPLKLLAQEAAENPSQAFVLVIDEINRANLAKVFGELYFLLEYRDRAVALQYSPTDEFRLPPNVFLLGTMNTADRSIALVDAAMRRRFAWQGLFPGEPPVSGMLRGWLAHHRLSSRPADLLDELNRRVADRDAAIGPSYLMTPTAATDAGLRRIWKHQILPLLEERHIGDGIDVTATYSLDALTQDRPASISGDANEPLEETGEAPQ